MSIKSGNFEIQNVFIYLGRSVMMNIQSDYSYNISMQGKRPHTNRPDDNTWKKLTGKIKQKIIDIIPEKTFKGEKAATDSYEKTNNYLSRPDVNRLIMGATAISLQPWIDRNNPWVDEDTRKISMYRTMAKIIAGTTVGVLVRGSCYRLVGSMTDLKSDKKHSKALIPKAWLEKFAHKPQYLNNYKSTLSTFMALGVMVFTNFLLDAPFTLLLTNKFNENAAKREKRKEVING